MINIDLKFQEEYNNLWINQLQHNLKDSILPKNESLDLLSLITTSTNYAYLLSYIQANIDELNLNDIALRVAQYTLIAEDSSDTEKSIAENILNMLGNKLSSSVINPSIRRSFRHNLELYRYDSLNNISTSNGLIDTNHFQKDLWHLLENSVRDISISAPTSAGKSYIMKKWLAEYISKNDKFNIVYLAPTRSLISEVERDLLDLSQNLSTYLSSIPTWEDTTSRNIFVLTQERLGYLFAEKSNNIDLIIIDEAYKISDKDRGVLLQQVLEQSKFINIQCRHIFLSPLISNPEEFINKDNGTSKVYHDQMVNQNLFWVEQEKGKLWNISCNITNEMKKIGELSLDSIPNSTSKRMSYISYHIGKNKNGNLIYVNGAADAEKIAAQLYGLSNFIEDSDLDELSKLSKKIIHKDYLLNKVVKKGIAYHYGNMPLILRSEIERLFKEGKIKFLICTSTLVEGVNLPCSNLFVRNPKKGNKNHMEQGDFWNLAGRAGRWGLEIQGNIFCIDPNIEKMWKDNKPPKSRVLSKITSSTKTYSSKIDNLIDYIDQESNENEDFEVILSYITTKYLNNRDDWDLLPNLNDRKKEELIKKLESIISNSQIPEYIIKNNPGISIKKMNSLLDHFINYDKDINNLIIKHPSDSNSVNHYMGVFKRIHKTLSYSLGSPFSAYKEVLVSINWMNGYSTARIINEAISHYKDKEPNKSKASIIIETLKTIEQVSRFKAPKFLSCYKDILDLYKHKFNNNIEYEDIDFKLFLEFGANSKTQISLIKLGLSRATASELYELITDENLSKTNCLEWIIENESIWRAVDLPQRMIDEIEVII